ERQVGVRRKSVAVRDGEADAGGIAVAPHTNSRAALQGGIERLARRRDNEIHSLSLVSFFETRGPWLLCARRAPFASQGRSLIVPVDKAIVRKKRPIPGGQSWRNL